MPLRAAARPLYALGAFGSSLLQQTVLLWVFFFYAAPPGQGLPQRATAAMVGLAMAVGRVVDALADPVVAHWSDGLRSRWGRRRPFILGAAPLVVVCFLLVWHPPTQTVSRANAVHLGLVLSLFFFLYTMVLNPWAALLPEITAGGEGRIPTVSWVAAFTMLGVGAGFVGSSFLSTRFGFSTMAVILAPVGLAGLLLPLLAVRERIPAEPPQPFRQAFFSVLRDPRFRIFLPGLATLVFGVNMVTLSVALIVTVLMGLPRSAVGMVLGISLVTTLLTLPLVGRAAARSGYRQVLLTALGMLTILLILLAGLGRWRLPFSGAAVGVALIALAGPAIGALFLLPHALLTGIAEDYAVRTGGRSEGMFFAFQGLTVNGTTSLSAAVLGTLLDWLGYAGPHALGVRAALLVAALSTMGGALIFLRYPDDRPPRASLPSPLPATPGNS